MFASMDDTVWLALVAIISLIVKQVLDWVGLWVKIRLDRERADDLKKETQAAASALKEETQKAAAKVDNHLAAQDQKIIKSSEQIEIVHLATNSLKDELVAAVKQAATAEGNLQGRKDEQADFPHGRGQVKERG